MALLSSLRYPPSAPKAKLNHQVIGKFLSDPLNSVIPRVQEETLTVSEVFNFLLC